MKNCFRDIIDISKALLNWRYKGSLNDRFDKLCRKGITVAELLAFDRGELQRLGFKFWDGNLLLVPLQIFPFIARGEILLSIRGDTIIVGREKFINRSLFGCIPYGFVYGR